MQSLGGDYICWYELGCDANKQYRNKRQNFQYSCMVRCGCVQKICGDNQIR